MKILLVEDEEKLAETLTHVLKRNNYDVDTVGDGIKGEELALVNSYDAIVLDRMLPGKDGTEVLKNIRAKGVNTPVIFVTAKHTIEDRIEGLDAGADDYITKPFSNDELLARIRAMSRRIVPMREVEEIEIGKSKFMPRSGEVFYGKNFQNVIKLTLKETSILELFCENIDKVLTKEEILAKLWGAEDGASVNENLIEVFISYLRKKTNKPGVGFEIITIRGMGYKIRTSNIKGK